MTVTAKRNLQKLRRGFTLVELLVVIAIIGLLSSVAVVSLDQARAKSRDAKRLADMRQIQNALAIYYDANGFLPWSDGDGCGTWDVGNRDYPLLGGSIAGAMNITPRDPTATGNCGGYFYFQYPANSSGCDASKGNFYVLGVVNMETSPSTYPGSPGWSCPGRNWQAELEWVTGAFTTSL